MHIFHLTFNPSAFNPIIRIGKDRSWNNFDFMIVIFCWIPARITGGSVIFLRLLRLMRLLKLVGKVKKLQIISGGLVRGLGAVKYIILFLIITFFIFAVFGVDNFGENDPSHFGSLGIGMLSLFRIATLDSWTDAYYLNYFGCDTQYTSVNGVFIFIFALV